ncbi:MAG: ABC transporter substrate-binding protein [Sulfuricella sp.]|nr:ABC transporter substrate-binding protein [Sulfuricella sp.]
MHCLMELIGSFRSSLAHSFANLAPTLFILVILGTQTSCERQHSSESAATKVVTAAAINAYSGPFYIAAEKGFWKAEGLDVTEKYFASGRMCLDALLAGSADIITVAETPIVFAGFSGQNVVVVSTISSAKNDIKVIARKDHGINKPEDLRGKKVAMLFGATSEYFAGLFLNAYGISFKDINRVNLNPSDMPVALIKGDIDAYVIWEPFVYNAYQKLGDEKAIRFMRGDLYTLPFNMAVRKDFAERNPDTVERALRAVIKANEFINKHPDDAISIVSKRIGTDERVVKAIWSDYEFNVELSPLLLDALQREAKWAKEAGIAPATVAIPDYKVFIDARHLKKVAPSKVSME